MVDGLGTASGRCLCGSVRYVVRGPLRDAIVCHCVDCRRWHGSSPTMVAAPRTAVEITGEDLAWFAAADKPRRGFCRRCGASLFWDAAKRPSIAIAAGTLDDPSAVAVKAHIFAAQRPAYEAVPDGVPCYEDAAPPGVATGPADDPAG